MSIADPNKTILTGENPFIRLSLKDGDPNSTDASYWRVIFSPAGPGHVLYLKSELAEGRWRIYSDSIAMARSAADDCTRHAQCRIFRHNDPLCGGDVFQGWRSPLLLDRAHQVAQRRHLAHLVRYRRAAAHPLAAEPDPQPALRCMHCIDTSARHAPRPQRH